MARQQRSPRGVPCCAVTLPRIASWRPQCWTPFAAIPHGQGKSRGAHDAHITNYDAADGIVLRERDETVHRLSGVLMAVLDERMSAGHHDRLVGPINLIVSSSQHRREEPMGWIAWAASEAYGTRR